MFFNSLRRDIPVAKVSGGLLALYKTIKISCFSKQQVWQKIWTGLFQGMPVKSLSERRWDATKGFWRPYGGSSPFIPTPSIHGIVLRSFLYLGIGSFKEAPRGVCIHFTGGIAAHLILGSI